MFIPPINGQFPISKSFIFTAADSTYFDIHGKPLIASVLQNTNYDIHMHIYNPTTEQIRWCQQPRVTTTYEYVDTSEFQLIAKEWMLKTEFENKRQQQMFDKGKLFGVDVLTDIITKTYYACCRFVRLAEVIQYPSVCLAIDVDGIVRGNFSLNISSSHDVYLYQKKSLEHLAGAILFTEGSESFIKDYARNIKKRIANNDIYWFMDQVVLDRVITKYNKGLLPMSYIDWEMDPNSTIWSAKGKRKDNHLFIAEQKKYNS